MTEVAAIDAVDVAACLGEYTALTFAGALIFEDGLVEDSRRVDAIAADATSSCMASVISLSADKAEELAARRRGVWCPVRRQLLTTATMLSLAYPGHRKVKKSPSRTSEWSSALLVLSTPISWLRRGKLRLRSTPRPSGDSNPGRVQRRRQAAL